MDLIIFILHLKCLWGPNLDTFGKSNHIEGVKMVLPVLVQKIQDPFYNSNFSIHSNPKMRTKTFDFILCHFWVRFLTIFVSELFWVRFWKAKGNFPKPRHLFETKFFENKTDTFFETKFSETETETLFRDQIFRKQNRNLRKIGKSFETEKFRNRKVNLCLLVEVEVVLLVKEEGGKVIREAVHHLLRFWTDWSAQRWTCKHETLPDHQRLHLSLSQGFPKSRQKLLSATYAFFGLLMVCEWIRQASQLYVAMI